MLETIRGCFLTTHLLSEMVCGKWLTMAQISFTPYFPLMESGDGYWECWLHSTAADSPDLLRACECLLHTQNRGQKEAWIPEVKLSLSAPSHPLLSELFYCACIPLPLHTPSHTHTHCPTATAFLSSSSPTKALIWFLCCVCLEMDGASFSKKSRTLEHGMVDRTWASTLNLDIFLFT